MNRRHFIISSLALGATPSLCYAQTPLNVVTTTGVIADAVRVIGGSNVSLRSLMGPGVDPHAYRQTRSDIAAMLGADLVLSNGLHLEAQMLDFLDRLGQSRPVVPLGEMVPQDLLLSSDQHPDKKDPHIWMVPRIWAHVVRAVADILVTQQPENADFFTQNAQTYQAELEALQTYAKTCLSTVPEAARILVTAHDAFSYFGREFGFQVEGIQGISTESEAGLAHIAELVDMLVTRSIPSVFVETSVSDRNIRALIEGANARGHQVRIGGDLFSDAMGALGTYTGTYTGMIDHNVTTITRALGGTAPTRGMHNMLEAF
jgi:manganese/zinc/iron transport system substrate-binding protein